MKFLRNSFFFISVILISGSLYLGYKVIAQQKDAIGVRIMPNGKHLPVAIWYEEQSFINKGKPKAIEVDGYDAIQDGRTVYVNAVNVRHPEVNAPYFCDGPQGLIACSEGDRNFYTNVYVISYSGANEITDSIFNQIINNWHFNKNISDEVVNQKLRRDARRLVDIAYVNWVLEKYYDTYKKYPMLEAGSYLKGQTMSKWPSWQGELGSVLGIKMPEDPINSFYPLAQCPTENPACFCKGYNAETCWDDKSRLFNAKENITDGLENDSNDFPFTDKEGNARIGNIQSALVYYYLSSGNGSSYEVGAHSWETPYIGSNYIANMQSGYSKGNTKPIIEPSTTVNMALNKTEIIELSAYDNEKYTAKLEWSFNEPYLLGTSGDKNANCAVTQNGTKITSNAACCIKEVEILPNNQKSDGLYGEKYHSYRKIKITSNNNSCEGKIKIKVKDDGIDGKGETIKESDENEVRVRVKEELARIIGLNKNFGVVNYPFKATISGSQENISYTWSTDGGAGCLGLAMTEGKIGGLALNGKTIEGTPTKVGLYCIKISAAGGNDFPAKINILNNPPSIRSMAKVNAVTGKPWTFDVQAYDNLPYPEIDNKPYPHLPIEFTFSAGSPSWLTIDNTTREGSYQIFSRTMHGTPNESGPDLILKTYNFTITAKDSENAQDMQAFELNVINHDPKITKWPDNLIKRDTDAFTSKIEAHDEDGHALTYTLAVNPRTGVLPRTMLQINAEGNISPVGGHLLLSDAGMYNVTVTVKDGYGGEDAKIFPFTINTYCGDKVKQNPNMEGLDGPEKDGDESCDAQDGVASTPAESSKLKQYECTNKCTPAGGWCGDKVLHNGENGTKDFGEKCDGTLGIAKKPEESSPLKQYGCSIQCSPTGGYCGDGIVNGKEVCDGNSRACTSTLADGLPAHCNGALFQGTQACNSNCTGWEGCVIPPPTIVGHSSTACNTTSPAESDYACCALISCVNDACGCCGRSEGAGVPGNYTNVQTMSPCEGESCKCYVSGRNLCDSCAGCHSAPSCNTNNGSCRVNQSVVNKRNWIITTNHTTAYYQCWK